MIFSKKFRAAIFALCVLGACVVGTAAFASTLKSFLAESEDKGTSSIYNGVCRISLPDGGYGTGFYLKTISAAGGTKFANFMTCNHVVEDLFSAEDNYEIQFEFYIGKEGKRSIMRVDSYQIYSSHHH